MKRNIHHDKWDLHLECKIELTSEIKINLLHEQKS